MAKRRKALLIRRTIIISMVAVAVLSVILIAGCANAMATTKAQAKMILPPKEAPTPEQTQSIILTESGEGVPVEKAAEAAANQVNNAAIQEQVKAAGAETAAETSDFDVLKRGMENEGVTEVQQMLSDLGYLSKVTGFYGGDTTEAVQSFQSDHDLQADGIVGYDTWVAMQEQAAQ